MHPPLPWVKSDEGTALIAYGLIEERRRYTRTAESSWYVALWGIGPNLNWDT